MEIWVSMLPCATALWVPQLMVPNGGHNEEELREPQKTTGESFSSCEESISFIKPKPFGTWLKHAEAT